MTVLSNCHRVLQGVLQVNTKCLYGLTTIMAWPDIPTGTGEVVKNLKNFFGQGEKNIWGSQF